MRQSICVQAARSFFFFLLLSRCQLADNTKLINTYICLANFNLLCNDNICRNLFKRKFTFQLFLMKMTQIAIHRSRRRKLLNLVSFDNHLCFFFCENWNKAHTNLYGFAIHSKKKTDSYVLIGHWYRLFLYQIPN